MKYESRLYLLRVSFDGLYQNDGSCLLLLCGRIPQKTNENVKIVQNRNYYYN